MDKLKTRCIFFGLWIGFLLAGSVIVELFLQGQVYSYHTFTIVLILSVTGIFSGIISWRLFSHFGRTTHATSLILSLAILILFIFIGSTVSYVAIEVVPEFFETAQDPDHSTFKGIFTGMISGFLSAAFAFKTFGLLLLWPFGVLSGLAGTFLFVHINSKINSNARH